VRLRKRLPATTKKAGVGQEVDRYDQLFKQSLPRPGGEDWSRESVFARRSKLRLRAEPSRHLGARQRVDRFHGGTILREGLRARCEWPRAAIAAWCKVTPSHESLAPLAHASEPMDSMDGDSSQYALDRKSRGTQPRRSLS
jgi:hypothetical protein